MRHDRARTLAGGHTIVIALGALAAACSAPAPVRVADLDGALHAPLDVPVGAVHVLVFTSHECPIANAYAPTLQSLAARSPGRRERPVRWFLVHVDPDLGPTAAREHAAAYALPGTILLDPFHDLARAVGATRTPEAVVLLPDRQVYRGPIDDQWVALGTRRPAAQHHLLADAIDAALAGEPMPPSPAAAVGCLLPEPRRR